MPIEPDDLPPEIRAILGQPVREGACINEQPVCTPDARVTAQLTDDDPAPDQVRPWRIKNAFKGNLILSPGGPAGMIGGLLKQLHPPQRYSHMGLMVDDHFTLRQATSSADRLQDWDHFATGSILGTPAPTDGM